MSSKVLTFIIALAVASPAFAQAPGAPGNLSNTVNGTTVVLTWNAAAAGTVTGYLVEASVVPGGANVATLPVAGTSLTVPNVPPGTYFVRVRALNGAAQSAPSNEVTVSVVTTGCPGPPTAPIVSIGAVGLQANASWSSGPGCPATSFVLQAGSAPGLANIAQINVGGQLAVSAMVPPGNYYVRVIGSNQFGTSPPSEDLLMRVAVNALSGTIRPNGVVSFDVALTQTGPYIGSLTWVDPAIDLDFYLTSPGCPYPPTGCLLAISDAVGVNVETVTQPVVAGQSLRLYVDNFTNRTTSFTIINTVGGAPADQPDASADVSNDGSVLTLRKQKGQD
jgi:Fibronectin type III domain